MRPVTYQPKGSMCVACKHLARECKDLPFSTMPQMQVGVGVVVVKCSEFEQRKGA